MTPRFFRTPAELRKWFKKHHATENELWVGYYKVGIGKPTVTWPESVDEALCVGWIDGIRKSIDEESYTIASRRERAGARGAPSISSGSRCWSTRNGCCRRGCKAFEARRENKSGIYSYEQRRTEFDEPYLESDDEQQEGLDVLPGSAALLSKNADLVHRQRETGGDRQKRVEDPHRRERRERRL